MVLFTHVESVRCQTSDANLYTYNKKQGKEMTEQSDFSSSGNDPRAYRVVSAIEAFVDNFARRVPSEHATDVLYDSTPLDGRKIKQAPERFIEEHLIRDVANALGYDYRPQPKGFEGLDGRIPDFTITNTGVTVIGEIKRPNHISDAESESVEYLDRSTEYPSVGIATDGWTWIMYVAKQSEEPTYHNHVPLRSVIRDIARDRTVRHEPKQSPHELRQRCTKFATQFGIGSIQAFSE